MGTGKLNHPFTDEILTNSKNIPTVEGKFAQPTKMKLLLKGVSDRADLSKTIGHTKNVKLGDEKNIITMWYFAHENQIILHVFWQPILKTRSQPGILIRYIRSMRSMAAG